MSSLTALQARRGQLIEDISNATAAKDSAERTARRATENARFATDPTAKARYESQAERARGEVALQTARITKLSAELAEVNAQIAELQRKQGAVQSTGETVAQAQKAKDDGASTQNPSPPAADTTPRRTNATRTQPQVTTGTDGRVRRATETQSTPANTAAPGGVRPSSSAPKPADRGGAAAAGDDSSNGVRATINNLFGGPNNVIKPRDNVLDRYASYTYSISIYLMSPENFKTLVRSKKKSIPGWQLLMRSGGAPTGGGTSRPVDPQELQQIADGNSSGIDVTTLGRNQFFPLDYYIDDVRLESLITGRGTLGAHNTFQMKFKIIEPNGISFLDNLYEAVKQYVGPDTAGKPQSYYAQNFLMVIRWYGYDDQGNLVANTTDSPDGTTDTNAIVEKFIPFQFTQVRFRIANRLTEYECEAFCPQHNVGQGSRRGIIQEQLELTGSTLQEVFVGNPNAATTSSSTSTEGRPAAQTNTGRTDNAIAAAETYQQESTTGLTGDSFAAEFGGVDALGNAVGIAVDAQPSNSAPAKANAAAKKTLVNGLTKALNRLQADLVKQGVYKIADEYDIKIVEPALQNSKVQPPGEVNKKTTPMVQSNVAANNLLSSKISVNKDSKTVSVQAGTSIVQFIDQLVRTSTYIYDQQLFIVDPTSGETKPQGSGAITPAWYRISMEVEPIAYDELRNDYAYKITYQVNIYQVNDLKSDYFPRAQYRGPHKLYNYWFTGENKAILNFEQNYNYLYYIVANSKIPNPRRGQTSNWREVQPYGYQTASGQSNQGQPNGEVNEASANAADYLYSPADTAEITLTIVGDPAWIQQGDIWTGIPDLAFNYGPFLADGTINYESAEILFEVLFNKPVDYDMNTGLMDPGKQNYQANRAAGESGQATQTYVYNAYLVSSIFSRGRFTQELKGYQKFFDIPQAVLAAQASSGQTNTFRDYPGDQSDAETKRLQQGAERARFGQTSLSGRQQQAAIAMKNARRDQVRNLFNFNSSPPSGSSLSDEGFTNDSIGLESPSTPPTSSGQTVGPGGLAQAQYVADGGAIGAGVPPFVEFRTNSGATVYAASEAELTELVNQGRISVLQRRTLSRELAEKQTLANARLNAQQAQTMAKER